MKVSKRRTDLTRYIDILEGAIKKSGENTEPAKKLAQLKIDIRNDFFTVLVVGEFKRGKSTFVNALLGEDLMITNVIPETATIQAVMYGEEKLAEVIYGNGEKKRGSANKEFLSAFSANCDSAEKDVRYIKISYPCELLKNNVVLVDTPGVADMDEQRVQVTYDFLPKANAVIMVLDATSPMSRSEKEFIEEHLLTNGIRKVIFLLNRIDIIDEDEVNLDEYLTETKQRIRDVFSEYKDVEEPVILPVSSYMAMEGLENKDNELIEKSGIKQVKAVLQDSLFGGKMEETKLDSYKYRLEKILEDYLIDFENDKKLLVCNTTELSNNMQRVNELREYLLSCSDTIDNFVGNETQILITMLDKSLAHFREDLLEDILYEIDRYQGTEFKVFMERDIPHLIKKKTDAWLMNKGHNIDLFYRKMEQRLSDGLSYLFKKRVYVDSENGEELRVHSDMQLTAKDVSGATIQAGAVTAVGAIAMSLMGFGAFAPLIGYAVLPAMRDGFLKNELKESKEMAIPLVQEEIENHIRNMQNVMEGHIYKRTDAVTESAKRNHSSFLNNYQSHVEQCLEYKNKQEQSIQDGIADIDSNCEVIRKVLLSLDKL